MSVFDNLSMKKGGAIVTFSPAALPLLIFKAKPGSHLFSMQCCSYQKFFSLCEQSHTNRYKMHHLIRSDRAQCQIAEWLCTLNLIYVYNRSFNRNSTTKLIGE